MFKWAQLWPLHMTVIPMSPATFWTPKAFFSIPLPLRLLFQLSCRHNFTAWTTNKIRSQECLKSIASLCLWVSKCLSDNSIIRIVKKRWISVFSCESVMKRFIACTLGTTRRVITLLNAFFLQHWIYCMLIWEEHSFRLALIVLFFRFCITQ